jgi:hypothetical protein
VGAPSVVIEGSTNGDVQIQNCILWDTWEFADSADVTYSDILGGYPGEGNINADPHFYSMFGYGLTPASPCIDSATVGPALDLSFDPRPVDIPGIGREGEGAYDMGVFEFQLSDLPTPTPTATQTPIPTPTLNPNSNIDQNGSVGVEDLMILLNDWMKVSGP